jgi:hypothetical protein
VEYANFANDWAGVSFSSVRAGTISERDMWIVLQNDMISQLKARQFLIWLRYFLTFDVSGGLPLTKFDKFSEHTFRGRRWTWVDPMKDMKSNEVMVAHGWKTNTQVAEDLGVGRGPAPDAVVLPVADRVLQAVALHGARETDGFRLVGRRGGGGRRSGVCVVRARLHARGRRSVRARLALQRRGPSRRSRLVLLCRPRRRGLRLHRASTR